MVSCTCFPSTNPLKLLCVVSMILGAPWAPWFVWVFTPIIGKQKSLVPEVGQECHRRWLWAKGIDQTYTLGANHRNFARCFLVKPPRTPLLCVLVCKCMVVVVLCFHLFLCYLCVVYSTIYTCVWAYAWFIYTRTVLYIVKCHNKENWNIIWY